MLRWAFAFLILALIAGLLGFTGVAGESFFVARILFFVFLVVFTNRRKGGYKNEVQILRLLYIHVLRRYDFNLHRVILKSWRSRRSTGVDVFSPDDGADDGVCRVDERRVKRDVEWW